jgi:fructose/tagatose bisphosphate aldolase
MVSKIFIKTADSGISFSSLEYHIFADLGKTKSKNYKIPAVCKLDHITILTTKKNE